MFQKATCQAAADFLPEKLRCCEGLAMLHWSCCQCQCHRFWTKVLQSENPQLRLSLSTRTWGADVPASWWHQAPGSHDWRIVEHKYVTELITELCLDPPATTVLRRKGGKSGSFGLWLRRLAFLSRFFWLLVKDKLPVLSIFSISYFYSEIIDFNC